MWGGQLQIWIQLQIQIWVVIFDLNFHCIDIMLTLWYLQNSIFCPITLFHVVRFEKLLHKQESLLETTVLSSNNLMLSSLCQNSVPSCQIWKNTSQTGVISLGNHFEYQQSYVIFKIEHFIPYFCLSQYYWLYVYKSHSLEWQFGTYSFMLT